MILPKSIVDIFGRLVSFDTTSRNSNLALIEYVADRLKIPGVRVHLDYNDDKTKANLIASIGPDAPGGIVLAGHTDTVPVDGQDWQTDPFTLTLRYNDAYLHGRGVADMKGFNALAIQQITDLAQNKTQLKRPLHLVLTYDEEVGCLGAQHALDHARDKIQTPDLVVVGEPTGAEPVDAHKGIRCFHTHVHGLARHSSNPSDKDSIAGAFSLIKDLYELRSVLKDVRTFDGNRFDPPYTTMNIGKIAGGTVINTTPEHCSFDFEIRPIPGQNGEVVKLRHILSCEALSRGSGLEAKTNEWATVPSFLGDKDHPGSRLLLDVLFHDRKAETECITAPFTTEAGLYQHAGWNTLVWGPGDIAQAHTANEHIRVGQLQNYRKQLQKLTRHCLKP